MQNIVSKAQFKAQALQFLRTVEENKQPLIITHAGKPVVEVIPYKKQSDQEAILKSLRGTLKYYKDPDEPVGLDDWEVLK